MNAHLAQFRNDLRARALGLLWAQWDELGATGHAAWDRPVAIDPDALLAFSCSLARQDARLFEEILDWLAVNGRFLNVQRLANVVQKSGLRGGPVLSAVADFMARSGFSAKWERLARLFRRADAEPEPLFYVDAGTPMPDFGPPDPVFLEHGFTRGTVRLREHARPFAAGRPANLWLALRALLGVNARCEIWLYLLLNGKGHARGIARETGYFQKTIQDALAEMGQSGFVRGQAKGRERLYAFAPEMAGAFAPRGPLPRWLNWPAVFAAVESIWTFVQDPQTEACDDWMLAARLHALIRDVAARLTQAGVPHALEPRTVEDPAAYVQTGWRELADFVAGIF